MLDDIFGWIWFGLGALVVVIGVGFIGIVLLALGMDLFLTIKDGKGYVCQERNCHAYAEIIKEENGCVYAVDIWRNDLKTCGVYQIQRFDN